MQLYIGRCFDEKVTTKWISKLKHTHKKNIFHTRMQVLRLSTIIPFHIMFLHDFHLFKFAPILTSILYPRLGYSQNPYFFIQSSDNKGFRVMVFNATINNISAISWRSVLLVEETRVPGEKPPTCRKSLTDFIT